MILTRSKTLLDAKVILKVSVTEGKSLTSGEVGIHKNAGLPKTARLLKILFPFHLEWKSFSKCKYRKITNLDKLTEICFANRRM